MRNFLKKCDPAKRQSLLRKFEQIPPETDDWLWDWCYIYAGVKIPRVKVCEDHVAPFTAFAHSYFARDPMVVWEGSRGYAGKSFLLSLLDYVELITLATSVRVVGGSGEQARRINEYLRNDNPRVRGMLWEAPHSPRHLLRSDTATALRLSNGGFTEALMASPKSIRGAHPVRLRIDEADEMELYLFDAAMGQTMRHGGVKTQTTISSTHHHPDGTMTEIKRRAAAKGWRHFSWCYRESLQPHGWLDPEEVEEKKSSIPQAMWDNEYELQEPNPEGRVFTPDVIKDLFDPSLGTFAGAPREECVVIEPDGRRMIPRKANADGTYAGHVPLHPGLQDTSGEFYTAADWARRKDWTVIHTMRKSKSGPDQLAAWSRMNRMPWPIMIAEFNNRVEAYGGHSMHDATGVGDVIHDYLTVDSEGFDFGRRKETAEMLSSYIAAVEAGEMVFPRIKPLYDAHRFLSVDQVWGSEHLPDEVVAAALAWRCRESQAFDILIARAF